MPSYYGIATKLTSVPPTTEVAHTESTVDAYVSAPNVTTVDPVGAVTALYASYVDAYVASPTIVLTSPTSIQLVLTQAYIDAYVAAPTLTIATIDDLTVSLTSAAVDAYVAAPTLTLEGLEASTVALTSAIVDAYVAGPYLILNAPDVATVPLYSGIVDAYVAAPTISTATPDDQEVSLTSAIVDAYVAAPTITSATPDDQEVALTSAIVDAYVASPLLELGTPGATTVDLTSAIVDAYVASPTLELGTPGATTVSLTSSTVDAYVASPSLVANPPGAATVAHAEATVDAYVANVALTAQALDSTTVSFTEAVVDAFVAYVPIEIEDVGPAPNTAACQNAQGWMYTDPFSAYNLAEYNGYVSVWYKANQPMPSWAEIDHKQVIFQAMNDQEDHVEMGIGRYGNTIYPDLYLSRNDNRDASELWTKLEEDEELDGRTVPDLFDGKWHHLVFGYEGPGVTGADGWYFWIDGERYGTTRFEWSSVVEIEDWFRGVQETTPNNFTELNVGFNHLVGPIPPTGPRDNENIYGCLDELMVVNTRTIGDRGGTSGEVNDDVAYLYNQGFGRLVDQVEEDNPNGLWDDVYNAWKFPSDDIGGEYKNPAGVGVHDLANNGNINSAAGIPGGGFTSVAIDCGTDLVIQKPTPYLYAPYQLNGPMSHPTNEATVVAWIKPAAPAPVPADGTLEATIVSQTSATGQEWALYRNHQGNMVMRTHSSLGGRYANYTGQQAMDTNIWYMVAGSFTLSWTYVYLWWYTTQVNYGEGDMTSGTVNRNTGAEFQIGTQGSSSDPAQCWIDDVLWFNEAIPNLGASGSLQWLFNDGAGRSLDNIKSNDPTFYDKIASHWNLNEEGDGTQNRNDDADGAQSALVQYGSPVGLITFGNIGTGPGHIVD